MCIPICPRTLCTIVCMFLNVHEDQFTLYIFLYILEVAFLSEHWFIWLSLLVDEFYLFVLRMVCVMYHTIHLNHFSLLLFAFVFSFCLPFPCLLIFHWVAKFSSFCLLSSTSLKVTHFISSPLVDAFKILLCTTYIILK